MQATFEAKKFWMDFKLARVRRDLTQKEVGAEFGVGEPAVSQWENQHRTPSAVKFLTLCKAFDLNPLDYIKIDMPAVWMQQQLFDLEELDHRNAGVGTSETVYRTKKEPLISTSAAPTEINEENQFSPDFPPEGMTGAEVEYWIEQEIGSRDDDDDPTDSDDDTYQHTGWQRQDGRIMSEGFIDFDGKDHETYEDFPFDDENDWEY